MATNPETRPLDREQEMVNAIWLNLCGLLFAGGGWYVHHKEQYERSHFKEVKGLIVDSVRRRKDNSLDYEYAPVIEFRHNGDPIRFNPIPHESYVRSTGTEVVVRYDPQTPQTTAYLLDPWHGLLIWLPFVMAGLAFSGGLHALWKLLRSRF
uniref:DUF3592 domain-containing protein n=1 Tax=Cyanothece sp. (strain PCC 7425 / ATCC 29141) TaxID=395961 RepID=B8HT31_CYAP4